MVQERYIQASSTDSWSKCHRRVWLDYNSPPGFEKKEDRFRTLLIEAGFEHEARVLAQFPDAVKATSSAHTIELMGRGVPVIYQPILIDDVNKIEGRPDFLIRAASGKYYVLDAKLSGSLHAEDAIQLSVYKKLLGTDEPAIAHLGNGDKVVVPEEYSLKAEEFTSSLRALLSSDQPPKVTFSETRCRECPYDSLCRPAFIAGGELTLVYGVDSRSAPGLIAQGITSIRELAAADPESIADVPHLNGIEKKRRAVLQARSFLTGEVIQVAPVKLPQGTYVHFDVETDAMGKERPVYLWGMLKAPYDKESYVYSWSDGSPAGDRSAWMSFVDNVAALRAESPDLVLIHFSKFELRQIGDYAKRYGMEEDPTVKWLRGAKSPFFDLQLPVLQSFVLPVTGYGLKYICKSEKVVNFQWELKESGSQWSVVRYLDYLRTSDPNEREKIMQEILSYNRDDVRATRALEVWLRAEKRAGSS